ncbi:tyrosine protein phosphatase LTP1 [Sporobolomyces salmoneus]|uniref:tyrosine protein phosphatase LTP1 n=1 Tax=Sporobolomyces salmoneus TaxID=183962 RepID=UPI003181AE76
MPSVLHTCLGNICRSPLAEAVFQDVVKKRGLEKEFQVDSCGTAGYHIGEEPDERTVEVCRKHGVAIDHQARQLQRSDFDKFDYILAMDSWGNLKNIQKIQPKGSKAKVALFGSYDDGKDIVDPYYGGVEGFEKAYEQCVRYSEAFLKEIGYPAPSDAKM